MRPTLQRRSIYSGVALNFVFNLELVKDGKITLHFVLTGKMLADCLTKHLAKVQFRSILQKIKVFSGSCILIERNGFLKISDGLQKNRHNPNGISARENHRLQPGRLHQGRQPLPGTMDASIESGSSYDYDDDNKRRLHSCSELLIGGDDNERQVIIRRSWRAGTQEGSSHT